MRYVVVCLLWLMAGCGLMGMISITLKDDRDWWALLPLIMFAVAMTLLQLVYERRSEVDRELEEGNTMQRPPP